jgi:dipeptide/tripeptide permease
MMIWIMLRFVESYTGYEAFERMAFYGVQSNLVNYLTTQLHQDTVSSVRNVNNWSGSVWITPILGAYIADSYIGRFWTFTVSSLIYVMVNDDLSN